MGKQAGNSEWEKQVGGPSFESQLLHKPDV